MLKKIFALFFIVLFLFSCWEESSESPSWLSQIETENLIIQAPVNWERIDDKEDILPKAKDSEIELAIASKQIVNGFSNNLLILSDTLEKFTTSADFSMLNNVWAQTDYLDYVLLDAKDFSYLDEEKSVLYIFEAKYNLDTPKLKFLQTAHICNQNKAYFLTLAIPISIQDTSKYEYLLSTFTCK